MRSAIFGLWIAFAFACRGVELRVATFNIGAHFGETYFDYSLGSPGTPDHDAVRDVLARIDADVVALQEIHTTDLAGDPSDLQMLQSSLGYPHVWIPSVDNAFDNSLRVVILSRHPFISTGEIQSPPGARELTRLHPVVKVDVPGTVRDPVVISLHLKSETGLAERFRRAVEMKRVISWISGEGLTDNDNFVVLGDFNPSSTNATFTALPSGLPGSYVLGSDYPLPITYSTNPLAYFSSPGAVKLAPQQLDGSPSTFGTDAPGGPVLDLVLVSPAIAARPLDTEIYNSDWDVSNSVGLPKAGNPPAASTSAVASDHYAVFADIELDGDSPDLDLELSAPTIKEGNPATVVATVTLPALRASQVAVTISSDDPATAWAEGMVLIPAGVLSESVPIRVPRNFLTDPPRSVSFTATATAYAPDTVVLDVEDADGPYGFTVPGQTIEETFDGFTGSHVPAPWTMAGNEPWRGVDEGGSLAPGHRSYGTGNEGSLGLLTRNAGSVASAVFTNHSSRPLTALRVSAHAEQWRAVQSGAAHVWSAELVTGGGTIPLGGLGYSAGLNLPTGAVPGGISKALSETVSGLWIAPGEAFELRFHFLPSPGGSVPSGVFVNEFHYDNDGPDTGEFVEIAVAPGYAGSLSQLQLVLYNGSNGAVTSTHALGTFTTGATTSSGHRLFFKSIAGIQNDKEGLALVDTGAAQVLQFISYEGGFAATQGPANGVSSTDIGLFQHGSEPINDSSLGLSGAAGEASGFAWTKFQGSPHTPGQVNPGQEFVVPADASQGIALDDVRVTFLLDADLDGTPDETDPDDDNDGQSDFAELAFGTDPLTPGPPFAPSLIRTGTGFELGFPGTMGIRYTVEFSETLSGWQVLTSRTGSGVPIVVALPQNAGTLFFRLRADN